MTAPRNTGAASPGAAGDFAVLTKSYAADLEMCRRLCASVDRHMPGTRHYLVIDRVDRALFAPLADANPDRVLVESEDHLPELLQTTLLGRRLWLTPYGPPIRGWIQQQLAKMQVVASLQEDAVVLIDSDALFVRPLRREAVLRDGRTRLFLAPGSGRLKTHMVWHRVAARVFGLPPADYFGADYISNIVVWRPDVVRAMLARIRRVTRLPWRMALSWRFRFSEYILYGVFADHAPGDHGATLFHATDDLCHCSWHYDLDDAAGRQAFLDGLRPHHVAVLLQSNLDLPAGERDALLDAIEAQA